MSKFLLMAATAFGAMIYVRRQVAGSINSTTPAMSRLSSGDLSVAIPGAGRHDEIGEMAKTLQVFKEARVAKRAADDAARMEDSNKLARAQRVDAITRGFNSAMGGLIGTLTSSADSLEATSEIARNVQAAADQSSRVASGMNDVSRGASETGSASGRVLSSAKMVSQVSSSLKTEVEKFLSTVQAA
ncbi:HAMP domain-containing protein [Bradyrhizobium sp.]|uniref:HAMP domain-containing protein n=1 Tax=Bradyrhizobium sp. TaxID=376 RepID=UPI003C516AC0